MHLLIHKTIIILTLIHLFSLVSNSITAETKTKTLELHALQHNTTNSTFSPWLSGMGNHRRMGCRRRPWICNQENNYPKTRRLCCRNRCIDVDSDPNNCGFCGIKCPFTWQCCRGICRNINSDPFHCGRCENRCQSPGFCIYGLCGYSDEPLPPSPFPCPPWRRRHQPCPFPPKPFPPRWGGGWPGPPPVG